MIMFTPFLASFIHLIAQMQIVKHIFSNAAKYVDRLINLQSLYTYGL